MIKHQLIGGILGMIVGFPIGLLIGRYIWSLF